jgi:hypothetical protein
MLKILISLQENNGISEVLNDRFTGSYNISLIIDSAVIP